MATLILTGIAGGISVGSGALGALATAGLRVAAGIAGNALDQALFGRDRSVEGPRLSELNVQASTEGAAIPRVYGRVRLAGQVIWASNFKEIVSQSRQSGGKGLGGPSTTIRDYTYLVSFAVALCEGEISRIGQIWADGKPLDISNVTYRLYRGGENQTPDTLIETLEGTGNAPGYRGAAYVVFEDLELTIFGNRIPQLTFEVYRPLNEITNRVRGVDLIPAAGEFSYDPEIVFTHPIPGFSEVENAHNNSGLTDWNRSLDDLAESLPNVTSVALVVAWFGDDLRAAQCEIRPRVVVGAKNTSEAWSVAGLNRGQAPVVSLADGVPAFGGTPSDQSVIRAIIDLKARGYKVLFYPFVMMDIPEGNSLTDPYTGSAGQPAYPWRGRITLSPAAGEASSPDKTAAAATQVDSFFEKTWGYRNFILHYANLVESAGGVDGFLIGSEMRTLSQARSGANAYPGVDQLIDLASDVKAIVTNTKISYAADWSEYFGHQPTDGSGDVYFHLDPLWANSNIDFIGIDNYLPLSDWRDGSSHMDAQTYANIYDVDYLKSNINGGEGYNWFYASAADRKTQTRTPITDGAGKPWVFRNKDIWNWWSQQHFNRPAGVEDASPTQWVPQSKPIYFTELGCPAIDKGANQPNLFIDPKSSESAAPHFSQGTRDDLIQHKFIEAHMRFWDPVDPDFTEANNPSSTGYAGRMVPFDEIYIWTWDARPFPDFPRRQAIWADGPNWELGHWITGRVAGVELNLLVDAILAEAGFTLSDTSALTGIVDGFVVDRIMSARDALEPLMASYMFDAVETAGLVRFTPRGRVPSAKFTPDDLVVDGDDPTSSFEITRAQETELPNSVKLSYLDGDADYKQANVDARRLVGSSVNTRVETLPIVMRQSRAQSVAEMMLQHAWAGRERAAFRLPPSRLGLDAGDVIELDLETRTHEFSLERLTDGASRSVEARRQERTIYEFSEGPLRSPAILDLDNPGPVLVSFLDLPLLSGNEVAHAPHIAAFANPWPGQIGVYRSADNGAFALDTVVSTQAVTGQTITDFFAGPVSRWDQGNAVWVKLSSGQLESRSDIGVLNGDNIAAIENSAGEWELFQFANAELVDANTYKLSRLLRGQAGTETAMRDPVSAGAQFVLISHALEQVNVTLADRNLPYFWRYGPANRGVDDPTYVTEQRTFEGLGLRPLSPVHVKGARATNNDLNISWVRRSRISADSWDQIDIPLGEESETYEVDIMNGSTVVRTLASATTNILYTAAQQTADFGAAPATPVTVRVHQLSQIFGRGTARAATLFT